MNRTGISGNVAIVTGAGQGIGALFTTLGAELAEHATRCNTGAPGSTDTQRGMWDERGAAQVIAGSPETHEAGIPLRKIATRPTSPTRWPSAPPRRPGTSKRVTRTSTAPPRAPEPAANRERLS